MHGRLGLGISALAVATCVGGCVQQGDDIERFRAAIPSKEDVRLAGPDEQAATGSHAASADEPWADGPWAKYYGFTRYVREGVNDVTGVVLGSVWLIVHTRPTDHDDHEAVWGPWHDSLSPAEYRLRVTEVATDQYEYALEGRKHGSSEEYLPVLSGLGYGRGDARHGNGNFTIDLDALRTLDPFEVSSGDSGVITITHDLDARITTDLFVGERLVLADVRPSADAAWWQASSYTAEDGSGRLYVKAYDDVDDTRSTALENIVIASGWTTSGAGRADITITGGDIPTSSSSVSAVECWGADFSRTYYADSVAWEPSEGEASACALDEAIATP